MEPPVRTARLAAMLTTPTIARPARRTIGLALPLVLLIAACGAAAQPSPAPAQTPRATPTAVPGASSEPGTGGGTGTGSGAGGGGGAVGGGAGGDPGTGVGIFPIPVVPADDPMLGDATNVVPKPGRLNPHPVSVGLIRAAVDESGVRIELRWWSGVEECYATDSVKMERDDEAKTIRLSVLEGSNAAEVACIDIAMLKATVVDIGTLAAGTWTISAEGDAKPIQVEVR